MILHIWMCFNVYRYDSTIRFYWKICYQMLSMFIVSRQSRFFVGVASDFDWHWVFAAQTFWMSFWHPVSRGTVWPRIVGWSLNSDPWHRYQMKAYTPSKTPLTEMQTKAGFPNNEISFRAGVFTTLQFHFCEGSVLYWLKKILSKHLTILKIFKISARMPYIKQVSTSVLTLLCLISAQSTQDPNSAVRTGFAPKNMSKTCHERIPIPEILNTPYDTSTAAGIFLTPEKNAQKHVPCLVDNRPKFCTIIVPSWCNGRGLR